MARNHHSHFDAPHNLTTPPELFEIRKEMRKGKPLPDGVTADRGVYRPRELLLLRFYKWIRPRRGCGCKAREARLNAWIPGLGTLVRWITTITGIKWLVNRWHQN